MRSLGVWKVLTFYGVLGGIGLLGMGEAHHPYFAPDNRAHWATALLVGWASGLALVLGSRLAALHIRSMRFVAKEFRALVVGMTRRDVALVAVLSGLSEEILFRGALQPALGLWLTTGIFGMVHMGPDRRFVPWTLMALLGGLVFGGLALWSGSLLASVVAHVTVNFVNLRFLASDGSLLRARLSYASERAVHS